MAENLAGESFYIPGAQVGREVSAGEKITLEVVDVDENNGDIEVRIAEAAGPTPVETALEPDLAAAFPQA
jgi:hypothetical protein